MEKVKDRHTAIVSALFFASGGTALVYELVWFELLRQTIGASFLSVTLVLVCFMSGLLLGSWFFHSAVPRRIRPLSVYALLELGIAVSALGIAFFLPGIADHYPSWTRYGISDIVLRSGICLAFLIVPTTLMGATLPSAARWLGSNQTATSSVGFLYAANIFGGVVGVFLAAFYLLPNFDLRASHLH